MTQTPGQEQANRPYRRDRKGFQEWIVPIDPIHNALVGTEAIANRLADLLDRDFEGHKLLKETILPMLKDFHPKFEKEEDRIEVGHVIMRIETLIAKAVSA